MPQATGLPLHEWSSVLIAFPLLIHLLLNWNWIAARTKHLFGRQPGQTRFNFFWDWALFAMAVTAFFSGIVISEELLPALGVPVVVDPFWVEVHAFTANSVTIMLGVHLAMHWQWLVTTFKWYVLRRPSKNGGGAA
jgi:cytochrome b subunit of formate dehydrogenase